MSFGGTLIPGAQVPASICSNIQGDQGDHYDADGNLVFADAVSGRLYTPGRFDTLIIAANDVEVPILGALVVGAAAEANADVGTLTTADPTGSPTEVGLPANFGPGRNKWVDITGRIARLRMNYETLPQSGAAPTGQGSIQYQSAPAPNPKNLKAVTRNYFNVQITNIVMIVECLHSIQG